MATEYEDRIYIIKKLVEARGAINSALYNSSTTKYNRSLKLIRAKMLTLSIKIYKSISKKH